MFRCPELAKRMRWHSSNHSEDRKMRAVDSEQWRFVDEIFPLFSRDDRNVRMGLALDGVNPRTRLVCVRRAESVDLESGERK